MHITHIEAAALGPSGQEKGGPWEVFRAIILVPTCPLSPACSSVLQSTRLCELPPPSPRQASTVWLSCGPGPPRELGVLQGLGLPSPNSSSFPSEETCSRKGVTGPQWGSLLV